MFLLDIFKLFCYFLSLHVSSVVKKFLAFLVLQTGFFLTLGPFIARYFCLISHINIAFVFFTFISIDDFYVLSVKLQFDRLNINGKVQISKQI